MAARVQGTAVQAEIHGDRPDQQQDGCHSDPVAEFRWIIYSSAELLETLETGDPSQSRRVMLAGHDFTHPSLDVPTGTNFPTTSGYAEHGGFLGVPRDA